MIVIKIKFIEKWMGKEYYKNYITVYLANILTEIFNLTDMKVEINADYVEEGD